MIYPMIPFPVTLSDPSPRFHGHGDALYELCAQLTRDLFAIAKFLFRTKWDGNFLTGTPNGGIEYLGYEKITKFNQYHAISRK